MKDAPARIHYAGNDFFVAITPSGHAQTLDVNPERSAAASPMELLLIGLGGCTGAGVISVLNKKREHVTGYRIEVKGDRRETHPRGFRRFEIRHILRGKNLSAEAVSKAIDLSTDKYCGVINTVRPTAEVVTSYEIHEDAG